MSFEVRPITPDELPEWVDVMHIAFHTSRPAGPEADYRLNTYQQDLPRSLGAFDGPRMVGTYESFPTELTLPGGACVMADAISSVTVLPTHHRQGILTRMISQDLRDARERGEVAAILIAAEYPIYGRFGFGPATERAAYRLEIPTTRFTRSAPGNVSLLQPQAMLQYAPGLFDRFRRMHPGQIARREGAWQVRLDLLDAPWRGTSDALRHVLYTGPTGEPEGYLLYRVEGNWTRRVPKSALQITELVTVTPEAYAGLWRFAAEIDLLGEISIDMRPPDEPLPFLLYNPRRALEQTMRNDFLWLRALDTARLLAGRQYASEGRLVVQVDDPLGLTGGRFELQGGPDGATCRPTDASADLVLSMGALCAISLGGFAASTLRVTGEVQAERPNALAILERMFQTPTAPWCSTFF